MKRPNCPKASESYGFGRVTASERVHHPLGVDTDGHLGRRIGGHDRGGRRAGERAMSFRDLKKPRPGFFDPGSAEYLDTVRRRSHSTHALGLGTRLCARCRQRKPQKGGSNGRARPWLCADCKAVKP